MGFVAILATVSCSGGENGPTGPPAIGSVVIAPASVTFSAIGESAPLAVEVRSASGTVLTGEAVTWASSNAAVASVSPAGLVTATGNGSATIAATVRGVSGSATVNVSQRATVVTVTPGVVELTQVGESAQLAAAATDARGNPVSATTTWSSSNAAVVTVNATGLVTAASAGTATITARVHDATGVTSARVTLTVRIASVSAGFDHTCAVSTAGTAYCWGQNAFGQLGDGTTTRRLDPVPVAGGLRFDSISAGQGHTCAVTQERTGYCWGNSDRGQVGDAGLGVRTAPARVSGTLTFFVIRAGRAHTCALTTGERVYCWGWGGNGELGNGATANRSVPDSAHSSFRYRALGGHDHTHCAVRTTGEIDCWGRNNTGQVGDGTVTCTSLSAACFIERAVPTRVASALSFADVSAGARIVNGFGGGTACAVSDAGTAYCWGQNGNGQIGEDTRTQRLTPVPVMGGPVWRSVDVGSTTTCGVTQAMVGYCWGFNGAGAVGDGTVVDRLVPVPVAGGLAFTQISVGYDHACGVTSGGDVYCWGSNGGGQLGDGTTTARTTPVRVTFPN